MTETAEGNDLELGLSRIVSNVSNSLAYVNLAVDVLPTLEELVANETVPLERGVNRDEYLQRLREDLKRIKGFQNLVNDYNNIPGSTEEERKEDPTINFSRFNAWEHRKKGILEYLIGFGDGLGKNYGQLFALAQFCDLIKISGGAIDYSSYGSDVTPEVRIKIMDALRKQEIMELRFFRGAIDKDDHVYKLLGSGMGIEEFREEIKKLKPELNDQSVVRLDSFKGDYELATILNFRTAEEHNASIIQVIDKKADQGSTKVRLYAVGEKTPAISLPSDVFQDATLTQLGFYEREMSRISHIRNRDGF